MKMRIEQVMPMLAIQIRFLNPEVTDALRDGI